MTHKILAIDDHPQTLDIIVAALKQYGYRVVSSLSAVEGLRLAQEEQPDLVLLDVNMPDMDGLEACRRLRADPQLENVPIIMFTAEDEPHQRLAGFDAGADDYLTKPTNPTEMIARIEGILGSMTETAEDELAPTPESSPENDHTLAPGAGRSHPPARRRQPDRRVGCARRGRDNDHRDQPGRQHGANGTPNHAGRYGHGAGAYRPLLEPPGRRQYQRAGRSARRGHRPMAATAVDGPAPQFADAAGPYGSERPSSPVSPPYRPKPSWKRCGSPANTLW